MVVTERSYFNLFPTAFVGYNPTDKWGMSLNYTRCIDRPSYYQPADGLFDAITEGRMRNLRVRSTKNLSNPLYILGE